VHVHIERNTVELAVIGASFPSRLDIVAFFEAEVFDGIAAM
jgi:hypothetical protein